MPRNIVMVFSSYYVFAKKNKYERRMRKTFMRETECFLYGLWIK